MSSVERERTAHDRDRYGDTRGASAVRSVELDLIIRLAGANYTIEAKLQDPTSETLNSVTPVTQFAKSHVDNNDLDLAIQNIIIEIDHVRLHEVIDCAYRTANYRHLPLRVRLDLVDSLYRLPWEQLPDRQHGRSLLALHERILLSRLPSGLGDYQISISAQEDLSALVAVAAPTNITKYDCSEVNRDVEVQQARSALGGLITTPKRIHTLARRDNQPQSHVTLAAIREGLRKGHQILYLICHGRVSENGPVLYLEAEDGRTAPITAEVFASEIRQLAQRPLLVALTACHSDTYSTPIPGDPQVASAFGAALTQAGVPAVVAMQRQITIDSAKGFFHALFESLAYDGLIDRAVAAGRKAITNEPEQWVPVLWMGLRDGVLWRPKPNIPVKLVEQESAPLDLPTDHVPPIGRARPGWKIDLNHNDMFVGRDDQLREIAKAFTAKPREEVQPVEHPPPATVVIQGLGGVGKTSLAVEFAYRYGRYFTGGVFWLNCAGESGDITREIAACLPRIQAPGALSPDTIEDQADLVLRHWEQHERPCLVICDTCEDEKLIVQRPRLYQYCHLLITSRFNGWSERLNPTVINLGVLPRAMSVDLLLRFRPNLKDKPEDRLPLIQLADRVGDLPLALNIIGRNLKDYAWHPVYGNATMLLQDLRRPLTLKRKALSQAGRSTSPTDHEQLVAISFNISLKRLDPKARLDKLALRILARAARFPAAEQIPLGTLYAAVGARASRPIADADFSDALQKRLINLGLITFEGVGKLRIHQMLGAVVIQTVKDPQARQDVIGALRREMLDAARPLDERRDVAFRLARVNWLSDGEHIRVDELRCYLDLIARFFTAPLRLRQTAHGITRLLRTFGDKLSAADQADLLIHRAAMRGQRAKLRSSLSGTQKWLYVVERDYQRARSCLHTLPERSQDRFIGLARVGLGLGNSIYNQAQIASDNKNPDTQRNLLLQAVDHYRAGLVEIEAQAGNPILVATIYKELIRAHRDLCDFGESLTVSVHALALLRNLDKKNLDQQLYSEKYAMILEETSLTHWALAQTALLRGNMYVAHKEYIKALVLTQEQIACLKARSDLHSYDLALAYLNGGDYLQAISQSTNTADLKHAEQQAREYWQQCLQLASDHGFDDLFGEAQGQLAKG